MATITPRATTYVRAVGPKDLYMFGTLPDEESGPPDMSMATTYLNLWAAEEASESPLAIPSALDVFEGLTLLSGPDAARFRRYALEVVRQMLMFTDVVEVVEEQDDFSFRVELSEPTFEIPVVVEHWGKWPPRLSLWDDE